MQHGIYGIFNTVNGRVYVGMTSSFKYRWEAHRYVLRHGKHSNRELQDDWTKYGAEAFEFRVLEECPGRTVAEWNAWDPGQREYDWTQHFGAISYSYRPPRQALRTIYLDQRHVDLIARYQAQHGGSFSSALRAILDEWAERRTA